VSQFDDERERARAAILKRRAKLMAYAVAAGVTAPACSGRYCLSIAAPNGGSSSGGSSNGGSSSGGGNGATAGYCLSVLGGYGGVGPTGGVGGIAGANVCLGMPYGGDSFGGEGGGDVGPGGAGSEGGALGNAGQAGEPPVYCLTPPAAPVPPPERDDEDR
jgi:hypothetical protein